jgi:hypothetical protein
MTSKFGRFNDNWSDAERARIHRGTLLKKPTLKKPSILVDHPQQNTHAFLF